jgi:hypothetical protein
MREALGYEFRHYFKPCWVAMTPVTAHSGGPWRDTPPTLPAPAFHGQVHEVDQPRSGPAVVVPRHGVRIILAGLPADHLLHRDP